MTTEFSDETTVVATYAARHDAEIARSFLEDQGIASFVMADEVHVPLQLTEGVRLVVMARQAQEAYDALAGAGLLHDGMAAEPDEDDEEEEVCRPFPSAEEPGYEPGWGGRAVGASVAAMLIIATLFFIPWRIEHTEKIMWAPIYRPPISHATTYQELGSARVHYERGEVALNILLLQVIGIMAAGSIASFVTEVMAQKDAAGEDRQQPGPR